MCPQITLAFPLACYLYWAVLKVVGVLLVGNFHYEDQITLVHGGAPFWLVVVFSPLTCPLQLLESITCGPTVAFVAEYRYGFDDPPHALLIVLLSVAISFVLAAVIAKALIRALRLIGGELKRPR